MQIKTMVIMALILMLTFSSALTVLPIANAHYPAWNYTTYCYVASSPPVVGVGQQELIVTWLNAVPPTAAGASGDRWTFYVDITAPDGTNETLGPLQSDPVGGYYTVYVPTQVGTYTIVSRFWTNNNRRPWQYPTCVCQRYLFSQHKRPNLLYRARDANPLIRRNPASNRLLDSPSIRQ